MAEATTIDFVEVDVKTGNSDGQLGDIKVRTKSRKELRHEAKRLASILTTPLEFKDIGFETALTKEEKAERKKAKIAAKKAAKKAKLAASGQVPAKKVKKAPQKRKKKKSTTTPSEELLPTDEAAEEKKPAEQTGESQQKSKATGKKKGKTKGKKGKEKEEPVKEVEAMSVIDMLRKRASVVLQGYEHHRKKSMLLKGRLSIINTKMVSDANKHRRSQSQVGFGQKASLVQINVDEDEESFVEEDVSAINIMHIDIDKKKKGKKGKKASAARKDDKVRANKIKSVDDDDNVSEGRRVSSSAKYRKKKSTSHRFLDEHRESYAVSEISQDSRTSADADGDDDRQKMKLKQKPKPRASLKIDLEERKEIESVEETKDKQVELMASRRESRMSRISRVRRASRASRASRVTRRKSGDYNDEEEVLPEKRAVPPMVPQPLVESVDVVSGDMTTMQTEQPRHEKKKTKKGKKRDAVKAEVPIEELSIMEQIALMKAQADAAAGLTEIPLEVTPEKKQKKKKKKKAKGKKMTKEQRSAYNAEKAEQERLAVEAEAAAAAEVERIRLNTERRMASETTKKQTNEQNIRNDQLQMSIVHILKHKEEESAHETMVKQEEEWIEYLKCDGLPDPSHCADMNTYLHLWEKDIPTVDMTEAERKTTEVLKLLRVLDLLIDSPYFEDVHKVANWKWVRSLVRDNQVRNLDTATYRLLRNIAQNMERLDIPTADFRLQSELFSLCVWLKVQLPIPIRNPRIPAPPRIKLKFPEMGLKVFFPAALAGNKMAIRAMYLKYDHLSDTCKTFDNPPIPEHYKINLQQAMADEWYNKLLYKYINRDMPKKKEITLEDGTTILLEPEPEPELLPGQMPPTVPYKRLIPDAEEHMLQQEDDIYRICREDLMKVVLLSVLNMREYVILGGVFYLDLYYQPPQPLSMVTYELTFTTLQRPLCLHDVSFYQEYTPPQPVLAGVRRSPEDIEGELKQQEAELDKLILVNLSMPQHVIWLDVPIVVYWSGHSKVWSKKHIYDFKHIEEKNYITFRTSIFGPFALASNKYASLPYQAWELKPEIDGTVTLQITTALLMLEFNIKDSLVSMTQLQNSPNNALQDIVGKYYKLSTLKKILTGGGVDIFPEADAFCYVQRTCEKHYPTEKHMYTQMAQLSGVFNFSWSRWNLPAGRRNIVCQMREYKPDKQRQKGHAMLMVNPIRTVFIECTEVSSVFSEVPTIDDSKMYADLYHLMKGQFNVAVRLKVKNHPVDIVNTLADLLIQTRVNSFS